MSGDPVVGGSEELVPRDGVREGQGRTGWGARAGERERFPAAGEALWRAAACGPSRPAGTSSALVRVAGAERLGRASQPGGICFVSYGAETPKT